MKEIITTLVGAYKEDKREFLTSIVVMILWALMTWFLLWFAGTFAYDM
jgi:small neutral amino acid transporter SnatA (MarC family)